MKEKGEKGKEEKTVEEKDEEKGEGEEEEEEGVHKKEEYVSMEEYPACRTNSAAASDLRLICTCCVGRFFQVAVLPPKT